MVNNDMTQYKLIISQEYQTFLLGHLALLYVNMNLSVLVNLFRHLNFRNP